MSTLPPILKAQELADILGCAVSTIEDRARKRLLPGLKFGDGGWVFPTDVTIETLNEMGFEYMQEEPEKPAPAAVLVPMARKGPPALPPL